MAHLRMMAAVQPFLSGAITKTVHLPKDATIEDVRELYEVGWKLGLKALALHRDGCKAPRAPSATGPERSIESHRAVKPPAADFVPSTPRPAAPPAGTRIPLPSKRVGFTQEARVGGRAVVLRTGEFENGSLGEIFIDARGEDFAYRSLLDCFATAVSVGLQHGVPLGTFVEQFTSKRHDSRVPVVGDARVESASSIVDYVFRVLGFEYQSRSAQPTAEPDALTVDPAHPCSPGSAGDVPRSADRIPSTSNEHASRVEATTRAFESRLDHVLGEAPLCDSCGHVTVRNGACYRCLNCGSSMGLC
jgi:ribonucleoside-diphosphate reductase alpha chain